jgi:hypothetical protein
MEEKKPEAPVIALPTGKVGRNQPCPCGSGRKAKLCCTRVRAEGGKKAPRVEDPRAGALRAGLGKLLGSLWKDLSAEFKVKNIQLLVVTEELGSVGLSVRQPKPEEQSPIILPGKASLILPPN